MSKISQLLSDSADQDPSTADKLILLVYDELRRLASAKMAGQPAGHSLHTTALVHEAYLRVVQHEPGRKWEGRRHFFSAAAESMRRILIDRARAKQRVKHGKGLARQRMSEDAIAQPEIADLKSDLIDIDAALNVFQEEEPRCAELVKLRFFVGLSLKESAELLGISRATADRDWAYARAWLIRHVAGE